MEFAIVVMDLMSGLIPWSIRVKMKLVYLDAQMYAWKWEKKKEKKGND